MKKKRFMKLLALASCVTLLTGCESEAFFGLGKYANKIADWGVGLLEKLGLKEAEKKDEKESEDKPSGEGEQGGEEGGQEGGQEGGGEVTPVPSMVVADLPERLFVGESLDLGDYVTLTNATEFEVVLEESAAALASVEGHVLTAIDEGDIEFTIKSGSLTKECSIAGIREERFILEEYFKDYTNEYTIESWSYDSATQQQARDDAWYHTKNYVYELCFDYDSSTQEDIAGGILRFSEDDEDNYLFHTEEDQGVETVVLDTLYSNLIQYYNGKFAANFAGASFVHDEQYDMNLFVLSGTDALAFAQNSLFAPNGKYKGYYPYSKFEFFAVDTAAEGEEPDYVIGAYSYIEYQNNDAYMGTLYFSNADADVGYSLLDAYCVPENKPESHDYYNEYFTGYKLSDFLVFDEGVFGGNGSYYATFEWIDINGDPADVDAAAFEDELYGWAPYFEMSANYVLTGDNSVWVCDSKTDELVEGETLVNGSVFYALPDDTDPSGYYVEEMSSASSVWADELTFAGLRKASNYAEDCFTEAEQWVYDTVKDDQDNDVEILAHSFVFNPAKSVDLINVVIDGLQLTEVKDLRDTLNSYNGAGVFESNFCDFSMTVIPSYGMVVYTLDIWQHSSYIYEINLYSVAEESPLAEVSAFEAAVNPLCQSA